MKALKNFTASRPSGQAPSNSSSIQKERGDSATRRARRMGFHGRGFAGEPQSIAEHRRAAEQFRSHALRPKVKATSSEERRRERGVGVGSCSFAKLGPESRATERPGRFREALQSYAAALRELNGEQAKGVGPPSRPFPPQEKRILPKNSGQRRAGSGPAREPPPGSPVNLLFWLPYLPGSLCLLRLGDTELALSEVLCVVLL